MTLNDIAANQDATLLASSPGQSGRTSTSAVNDALDQSSQRLARQQSSTEVQLSAFSQVRSAIAQLQDSSKALTATDNTDTLDETRRAAANFTNAFNNARDTADRTINGKPGTEDGNTDGALSGDGHANVAASQLSRTLSSTSTEALRSIGINRDQNGTLSIDQQRFEQALQSNPQQVSSTLANVGQQVEQTTSRQLEGSSNISRAVDNLSRQTQQLEAQQQTQQELVDSLQQATNAAANQFNFSTTNGIRDYERIFSL